MVYDFSFDNDIFVTDTLSAAMQELDLLFNTETTEVLGDSSFGTFFEQFLWDIQPRESDLCDYIKKAIQTNTYWVQQYDWDVNVRVNDGTTNATNSINDINYSDDSIYIITIDLYDNDERNYRTNKLGTKVIQF